MPALVDRIHLARKTRKQTQQQFAAALGIMRETQAAYETGRYKPSMESLESMARETGLPEFWFLIPTDPVEFDRARKHFEREAKNMTRLREVLTLFRQRMQRDMSANEWCSWEDIPPAELYAQILGGRLEPLSQRDLRKVHQYLRNDTTHQGVMDGAFYLYAIWARPRHPSMSDADYVQRVRGIVYPENID